MVQHGRGRDALTARLEGQPSWVLLVEVFIGLGWLRAAVSKAIDPGWWNGDAVRTFIASYAETAVPWYAPVQDQLVAASVPAVVIVVLAGQFIAGLSLLTGRALGTGLTVGMTMNLAFLLGGAVDPSIFYLVLQATLCLWLLEQVPDAEASTRALTFFIVAGGVVVLASAPFVRTLAPENVIQDPAAVTATYAMAIMLATFAARRRVRSPAAVLGGSV